MADEIKYDLNLDASEAAQNVTKLMTAVNELTKQLEGVNSDSAKELKAALAELAEVINTLDTSRLEHLDSILNKCNEAGVKLSKEGLTEVAKKTEEVVSEAKKFAREFKNAHKVQLIVEADATPLDTLKKRLEATEEANGLIEQLANIGELIHDVATDDAEALNNELTNLALLTKNLSNDDLPEFSKSFDMLGRYMRNLPTDIVKKIDIDGIASHVEKLKEAVSKKAETSKAADYLEIATSAARGNIEEASSGILKLIENSKKWTSVISKHGLEKAGLAMKYLGSGVASLIGLAKQYIGFLQEQNREHERSVTLIKQQEAASIKLNQEVFERTQGRVARSREIDTGKERAFAENNRQFKVEYLNQQRQKKLYGVTNDFERDAINRDFDRQIEDIGLSGETESINNERDDNAFKLKQAQDKQKKLQENRVKLMEAAAQASDRRNEIGSGKSNALFDYIKQVGDLAGLSTNVEDLKERLKTAEDVENEIRTMVREFKENEKDNALEIQSLISEGQKIDSRAKLLMDKERSIRSSRTTEDEQVRIQRSLAQDDRTWELSERAREESEADADAERDILKDTLSYEKKIAEAKQYQAQWADQLKEKESELSAMLKQYGEDSTKWTTDQAKAINRAEQAVLRLKGRVRSSTQEIRQLERQGNTEGYSRARENSERKRSEAEAERQQLREWRGMVGGVYTKSQDARDVLALRDQQLAENRNKLAQFIADKKAENNGRFSIDALTAEDKQRFNDLKSDVQRSKEERRTARGEVVNAGLEQAGKEIEFRQRFMGSNRLVSMGLAGGSAVSWDKNTAKNTEKMVSILTDLIGVTRDNGKKPTPSVVGF